MANTPDVIVIGAGAAGLGCSAELRRQGIHHVVIADQIGGRISASANRAVNYGAYIIGGDNHHLLRLVTRGRKLRLHQVRFHGTGPSSFAAAWRQPWAVWRLYRKMKWWQRRYHRFQNRTAEVGQRHALLSDPELARLYRQPAAAWLQEQKLFEFVQAFLGPIVRMCTFTELADLTAFDFCHVAMYLTIPVYEFRSEPRQLAADLPIMADRVTSVRLGPPHEVVTNTLGRLTAPIIILATPFEQTTKWVSIEYNKQPRSAVMYHLRGKIRSDLSHADLNIFHSPRNTLFTARQVDGTFLCYRLQAHRDFADLFDGPVEIIAERSWAPGFWQGGTSLLDTEVSPGVFLAGDHNVVGMEDSYISGLAAARAAAAALRHGTVPRDRRDNQAE